MNVLLANPRGFCAGVDRAIDIVETALQKHGAPIYVRHQVVHNKSVVGSLTQKGAVFIDDLSEAPKGSTVIFSAHGVSQSVRSQAEQFGLNVYDATCPLVTKVHIEVKRYVEKGNHVILIGHAGHPEVEGTLGQVKQGVTLVERVQDVATMSVPDPTKLAYVSQTTLSVDDTHEIIEALKAKFEHIIGPRKDDICYATQNRQVAVKKLAEACDLVLVVGSTNSSNSNRLKELVTQKGKPAYLIDAADEIDPTWLQGCERVGVTAGASAPEVLVAAVVDHLLEGGGRCDEMDGPSERVSFALPASLLERAEGIA